MKKIFFLSFFILFFTGCDITPFISPISTGIITWYQGEAHKYYNQEQITLYRAIKTSLRELDHQITKDYLTKNNYHLIAGNKDRFKIVVRQVDSHITEVKIRVNFLGDKPYAELIYKQIDQNLNSINFDNAGKPTKNKLRRRFSQE